jgi:stage II sporulation protein GA (sporulation sigma-E factor processing peptidase)
MSKLPGCAGRFRLIPYAAVGVKSGLLVAFQPDKFSAGGDPDPDVLVALSPTRLCSDGEYAAVIGSI